MSDYFTDYLIKRYKITPEKERLTEEKVKRVFNEYQQKIIDRHMKEAEGSEDDSPHFGPD